MGSFSYLDIFELLNLANKTLDVLCWFLLWLWKETAHSWYKCCSRMSTMLDNFGNAAYSLQRFLCRELSPVSKHVLSSVMSLLSLSKRLVTLKKSARAACDNDSLCDCVKESCDKHSGSVKEQPTASPSPTPPLEVRVYFRRPHLQQSASLTDTVCLARTVIYWNSRDTLR